MGQRWPDEVGHCDPGGEQLFVVGAWSGSVVITMKEGEESAVAVDLLQRLPRLLPGPSAATLGGRTGVCWDNAVAESFWASLKRECLQGHVFATRADARRTIFRWINWYNTSRLHTSLDGVPPTEWEQQYRQAS
jgi:hypothetical protein